MEYPRLQAALGSVLAVSTLLSACQQSDQELPFDLNDGVGLTASIGAEGGLVSVPPGFSIEFPAGSLPGPTEVTAAVLLTAFPSDEGTVVPGTQFDVGPAGVQLGAPARVQIEVPPELLQAGDEVRLEVAVLHDDGSVTTSFTSYDIENGLLTADVSELGPVAAVVSLDVIAVGDLADLPVLGGGSIAPPALAPVPAGPAPASAGGVEFAAQCSPDARSCLTSGIVEIWADDVVRQRLGSELVLANSSIEASIEFLAFEFGVPTQAIGSLQIDGDLRARINSIVSGRSIGDEVDVYTGPEGVGPVATNVTFSGNEMTFDLTSEGDFYTVQYGVTGIGTGEQLTIRLEGELEFLNADGPSTFGDIVVDVRLRR